MSPQLAGRPFIHPNNRPARLLDPHPVDVPVVIVSARRSQRIAAAGTRARLSTRTSVRPLAEHVHTEAVRRRGVDRPSAVGGVVVGAAADGGDVIHGVVAVPEPGLGGAVAGGGLDSVLNAKLPLRIIASISLNGFMRSTERTRTVQIARSVESWCLLHLAGVRPQSLGLARVEAVLVLRVARQHRQPYDLPAPL